MTEEEMDWNMKVPKKHLFFIILILFLLSGAVVGYVIGGYANQQKWERYDALREERVSKECTCLNKSVEMNLGLIGGGGLIIGANGLNVTMTAGTLWKGLNNFPLTSKDTSGSDTFDRYYRDGTGGFRVEQGVTEINNSKYDDGSGTLVTLTNNRYTVQWFYIEFDDDLVSLYGTAQYVSLGSAEEESAPISVPDRLSKNGILIGRVIIREGTDTTSSIESVFITTFARVVNKSAEMNLSLIGWGG